MVLLDSDLVAVDSGCCCGGCTFCGAYPPACVDEFDLCNTRQACNVDPTFCTGDTVPCDNRYRTLKLYCSDTCELCEIDHLNPDTCEITVECITEGCCSECDGGTSNETTDEVFPCGACCIGAACSLMSAPDCAISGGIYQGIFTVCFPDPC